MQQKAFVVMGAAALMALMMACGESNSPTSPANPSPAAADGTTLKATAPALVDPIGGKRIADQQPTLTFKAASAKYATGVTFTYRVQLLNAADAPVEERTGTGLSVKMNTVLDVNKTYKWKVRAEMDSSAGPWSATETFLSLDIPKAFNNADGLYDPLTDGTTIGRFMGSITFVPGKGVRLEDFSSFIQYALPQTVSAGEFSMIVTNIGTTNEGDKTKVMCMSEGLGDIITNERRYTLEKRNTGDVAWRMITHDLQIDTEGAERVHVDFHGSMDYLFQSVWTATNLRVRIYEGGASGKLIYDMGKGFIGRGYDPNPHYAFAGAPTGRSGATAATVPKIIVRQVWLSRNPRPAYANK